MGMSAPRVTPWAQLLTAGWQGHRAGLLAPWPSWPRACPCQDTPCPGSSLAEPMLHHTGSPGAIGPAHGKDRAPCVGTAAQSSLTPHQLKAPEPRKGQHRPYHQRSPARRGSQLPSSSCPPPAGRSWCHTGRSGSPAAGKGMGGLVPTTSPLVLWGGFTASRPPYLLTVLQLVHPELGSLETATVGEIWGEQSGSADTAPQCPTHRCHHPGPGPSQPPAPSPSHSPCPYRSRPRQPGLPGSRCGSWPHSAPSPPCPGGDRQVTGSEGPRVPHRGVAKDVNRHSPRPALTQMPRVTVWSPTVITLATKAAPIVCKRSKEERWEPARACGGIWPGNTVGTGAETRGHSPRNVRKEAEDTRGPTRGGGRDVAGPSPDTEGTTRGDAVPETWVAASRGRGVETGGPRAGRGGATRGAHPGEARERRGRHPGAARCRCVTHVLVGPGAEAAVGAALHEAALAHPLLPQQHHLGVHPPPAHPRAAAAAGRGRTGRGGAGTGRGGTGTGRGVPEVRSAGRKRAAGRGGARGPHGGRPAGAGLSGGPMGKYCASLGVLKGPWDQVFAAFWQRYPNPYRCAGALPAPFRRSVPPGIGATPGPQPSPFLGGPAGSGRWGWVSRTTGALPALIVQSLTIASPGESWRRAGRDVSFLILANMS